ncbi:MAG: S8 family peptidase, partial [Acidimicrobiales bacterium]
VGARVGTAEYARIANERAHRLQDAGVFSAVEADIPVRAFAPEPEAVGAFGVFEGNHGDNHRPGSEDPEWVLRSLHVREAWALPPPLGGAAKGRAIRVGHPDSGYSAHADLGLAALDLGTDRDLITNDDDAADPLVHPKKSRWPLPNPGHGTSTASVIVGRGARVLGIAPEAILVPLRATESVVQFFDSDVARAIDHARRNDCHVISMSLGGKGFFGLKKAIQKAVDSGMIVMAAAGNQVRLVTSPASYDNCLGVAAVGPEDHRWEGSSRGRSVDVASPGECVHVAAFDWGAEPPGEKVERSHGTSYAVAHLAGVAALWLGFHGRQALIDRYGPPKIQALFLHLLGTAGTRRPAGWDDDWGIGVADAEMLLRAPLPDPADVPDRVSAFAAAPGTAGRVSALLPELSPPDVEERLAALLKAEGDELEARLARYEGELVYLLLDDAEFRERFIAGPRAGAFATSAAVPEAATGELSAVMRAP